MLGISNLDAFILICKDWLEHAKIGDAICSKDVDGFYINLAYLLDEAEEELDEQALLKRMWSRVPCRKRTE